MSKNKLADLVDSTEGYINLLEYGQRCASLPFLIKIAKALNCSFDELLQDYHTVNLESVTLNRITKNMQGLSPKQLKEVETVVNAMLSYMKKD
jgi:DNA-binding helix-turn-helix protein